MWLLGLDYTTQVVKIVKDFVNQWPPTIVGSEELLGMASGVGASQRVVDTGLNFRLSRLVQVDQASRNMPGLTWRGPGQKSRHTERRHCWNWGRLMSATPLLIFIVAICLLLETCNAEGLDFFSVEGDGERSTEEEHNTTNAEPPKPKENSIADVFERVLDNEFPDKDPQEGTEGEVGSSFNSSVADQQAVLETVARVSNHKKNETEVEHDKSKAFQLGDLINLDDGGSEELPTLIDKKDNVFVISNPRSGYMVLQQDLRFISDLVVVIVSAAVGGIIFASVGQPVITGYLLAGSAIGPGGFSFVSELVQVETLAQFGVVFLLFSLGLEFSVSKLRAVQSVAVFGGLLQIVLFMGLCGVTAMLCGAKISEGVFVGAFLSMSSTAVVLKFIGDKSIVNAPHGQITVGTLILQDCAVGLLFALLPVLGGENGILQGLISMTREMFVLGAFIASAVLVARSFVPQFLNMMMKLSAQGVLMNVPDTTMQKSFPESIQSRITNELYQLGAVAFCLLVAWCSDKSGLSLELGAFVAGVMISSTEMAQHTLEQVEPIRNLFTALFLSSIGMLINIQFLWNHMDILLASLILVITAKTTVVTSVVKSFGYSTQTSFFVGMSLAQIGEFAFVLLSRASNLKLVQNKLYLLLLGTTALSLTGLPILYPPTGYHTAAVQSNSCNHATWNSDALVPSGGRGRCAGSASKFSPKNPQQAINALLSVSEGKMTRRVSFCGTGLSSSSFQVACKGEHLQAATNTRQPLYHYIPIGTGRDDGARVCLLSIVLLSLVKGGAACEEDLEGHFAVSSEELQDVYVQVHFLKEERDD